MTKNPLSVIYTATGTSTVPAVDDVVEVITANCPLCPDCKK